MKHKEIQGKKTTAVKMKDQKIHKKQKQGNKECMSQTCKQVRQIQAWQ